VSGRLGELNREDRASIGSIGDAHRATVGANYLIDDGKTKA
jgi:hypothetical protein